MKMRCVWYLQMPRFLWLEFFFELLALSKTGLFFKLTGIWHLNKFAGWRNFPPLSSTRVKILFVCSRNRRRSLTAEALFKGSPAWDARSAGTEEAARIKATPGLLGWADVIVVMEKRHKERLQQRFPEEFGAKLCFCFFIADDYEFMDANLVELLCEKMREHFPAIT